MVMFCEVHTDLFSKFYPNFKGKFNGDEELLNTYSKFIWHNKINS
jgi:hypothetical protein